MPINACPRQGVGLRGGPCFLSSQMPLWEPGKGWHSALLFTHPHTPLSRPNSNHFSTGKLAQTTSICSNFFFLLWVPGLATCKILQKLIMGSCVISLIKNHFLFFTCYLTIHILIHCSPAKSDITGFKWQQCHSFAMTSSFQFSMFSSMKWETSPRVWQSCYDLK